MERVETGMFARSKAGHDKGKLYIILRTESEYVYLTDGKLRPMANPKKKKIKHLVAKPEILEEIREKIFAKKRIFDSEVRNKLDAIGYQEALLPRKEG